MPRVISTSGVEKQAVVFHGQPCVSWRWKMCQFLPLMVFQYKANTQTNLWLGGWWRGDSRIPQLILFPLYPQPDKSPSASGYCWLLGFNLSLCSASGLGARAETKPVWGPGRAVPTLVPPPASPSAAGRGQLSHHPGHLSALPACQEGFCWLDAGVGRGGIQEAASRIILLIICSLKDRAEKWHRKRWCCGFLWHLNFILALIFAYELPRKEGEEEGQRLCRS